MTADHTIAVDRWAPGPALDIAGGVLRESSAYEPVALAVGRFIQWRKVGAAYVEVAS